MPDKALRDIPQGDSDEPAGDADTVIGVRGVTKTFAQWQRANAGEGVLRGLLHPAKKILTALDNVSFQVRRGEFVAYAGPNGAGKSTTMKLLCGMLVQGAGEISVLGMSPRRHRVRLMRRLGVLFGNRSELWGDHPVSQSFEWKRVVWDIPDDVYRRNLALVTDLLDLSGLTGTFVRELSLGQRMRADLALMLLHEPELILLDEPTLGLDVVAKRQMIGFLKNLNREKGVTIVVTSHDMDDLEEMAQRVLMVSSGHIVYDGGFDGLRLVAGSLSRLSLTMSDGRVPEIGNARLLSAERGVYTFEVDLDKTPVQELLRCVSLIEEVRDVELRKAPIEEVIAGLYQSWRT
jgi:ABC-2 type transport system ATP-binding protein